MHIPAVELSELSVVVDELGVNKVFFLKEQSSVLLFDLLDRSLGVFDTAKVDFGLRNCFVLAVDPAVDIGFPRL